MAFASRVEPPLLGIEESVGILWERSLQGSAELPLPAFVIAQNGSRTCRTAAHGSGEVGHPKGGTLSAPNLGAGSSYSSAVRDGFYRFRR